MKKKVLLSSIVTILLCLCLITGSTFALFTSQDTVGILVTSGKVDVEAAVEDFKVFSVTPDAAGTVVDEKGGTYSYEEQTNGEFLNKGTATLDTTIGELKLERITPGDKVSFTVGVTNSSNVSTAYRYSIACTSGEELMYGLNVTVNGTTYTSLKEFVSGWDTLVAFEAIDKITFEIELPVTAGNYFQDRDVKIQILVEAVQGNAANLDPAATVTTIPQPADYYA